MAHQNQGCGSGDSCSCGSVERGDGVNRREFLQVAGATVGALSASGALGSVMAGPFVGSDIEHYVPADKKLDPAWLASLTERGEPRVCRGEQLEHIGMPIGGIAAGQLYLRGDGTLSCWQIFNGRNFSGYGRENYNQAPTQSPVDQGFAISVERGGKREVRRLCREDFNDVAFTGEHPIALVEYGDDDSPVEVEMEAFSPFIPLNVADSALPVTVFHVTVRNTSATPVRVGVLSWLENAVCTKSGPHIRAQRVSRIERLASRSGIVHSVEPAPPSDEPIRPAIVLADFEGDGYGDWRVQGEAFGSEPASGTLPTQQQVSGFEGKGLVNTFLGGDEPTGRLTSPEFTVSRHYVNFLIGGGNHAGETCINLLMDGDVVRTATGTNQEQLKWASWDVREFVGRTARIEIVDMHSGGWGHVNIDQIELADKSRFGPSGPIEDLEDFGTLALMCDQQVQSPDETGRVLGLMPESEIAIEGADASFPTGSRKSSAILTKSVLLAPEEEHTATFVLAWHFPNRANGHAYANRFGSASAVGEYVLNEHTRLADATHAWRDAFYGGTLPRWLLDRIHSTVGNLATGTCQWWADWRFWAWEGVGCCHGTCTHVWNYAHALGRLFPELERSTREMQDLGVALHENGLVGFRGDLNNAYAADGQAGTVLKCYREHQMSADDGFLRRNWPNIKRVLEYSIEQDADDDGLIENSQHNTYDINFHGPNTFVGSLYLAALRAGEEMANIAGDQAFADRLRVLFESGRDRSVERLFDGEYFVQRVDLAQHPKYQYAEGCLSDQLFGQGWAHQLGLGYIYPPEQVHAALASVWKYNWAPDVDAQNKVHKPERWFVSPGEAGLFTCTWPKSEFLDEGVRYRNEVWTGIEYQVAGHMIHEGMVTEGLAIVRAIHDRYDPSKRNPYNEVECGDHYARALASWGVYTALCGFEYDGPRGHIGFSPRLTPKDFRAAFTAAEGWGTIAQSIDQTGHHASISLRWGKLRIESVALESADGENLTRVSVLAGGQPITARLRTDGGRLRIELRPGTVLSEAESLEITIT